MKPGAVIYYPSHDGTPALRGLFQYDLPNGEICVFIGNKTYETWDRQYCEPEIPVEGFKAHRVTDGSKQPRRN